jgi:hypothetical protein
MRTWVVRFAVFLVAATCCGMNVCASTGIYAAADGTVLFGNNEDDGAIDTYLWFSPAPTEDGYGGVYYGFVDRYPQGGMNERGLTFGHYTCPTFDVAGSAYLSTPPFAPRNGEWVYQMLERCESVAEALAYLSQFDLWFFRRFQLLLGDRFGDAAVIEGDRIIRKTGETLVVTNFRLSEPSLGNYPCLRYDLVCQTLDEATRLSENTILSALELSQTSWTCYSNIHFPKTGDVRVYSMHDFGYALTFNLLDELAKGARDFYLPDIFEIATRLTPPDGADLQDGGVNFSWYGTAVDYEIVLSVRPDLSNAVVYKAVGCSACTSPRRISRTVANLFPNTRYYWKLRAKGDEGFWTESTILTFTTGG